MFGRRHLDHGDLARAPPCCRPCPSCRRPSASAAAPARSGCATRRCAPASTPCSAIGLPNATRALTRAAHRLERALGQADQRACSGGCGPGPRRPCAISKPRPSPSSMLAAGTRTFSNSDLGVAVRRVVVAEHRQHAHRPSRPARRVGTRIIDCCWCRSALSGSVLPMKMKILQRGSPAPEVHHLRPLMT